MSGISDKAFDAWHSTADKWNWNSGQYEQPEQVVPLSDALTLERQLTSQAATIERLTAALTAISSHHRAWADSNVQHPREDDGFCQACDRGWPCETSSLAAAALGGSEGEGRG